MTNHIQEVRGVWHKLVLAVVAADKELKELGHSREAEQVNVFIDLFSRCGQRHCARLEQELPACSTPDGDAEFGSTPQEQPPSLESRCDDYLRWIDSELAAGHLDAGDQRVEVARKFLGQARSEARRRMDKHAERTLAAAVSVMGGAE